MQVTRVGLDLAKHVFQVHGVDEHGKVVIRKQLSRSKVLAYFAQLPVCRIGIEACGSVHYWGRELQKIGHEVRLMAMHLIKPYRTKQKNDLNDAEAICKAVSRPHMRFVPIKTIEQQYDRQIVLLARQNEAAKRLIQLDGIGPITATAVVATVGDATAFPHGRQFEPGSV